MEREKFTNEKRTRYYGLRVGDLVTISLGLYPKAEKRNAEVIDYFMWDNNRVMLRLEDGTETDWVAEWCTIVTKVEDREDFKEK